MTETPGVPPVEGRVAYNVYRTADASVRLRFAAEANFLGDQDDPQVWQFPSPVAMGVEEIRGAGEAAIAAPADCRRLRALVGAAGRIQNDLQAAWDAPDRRERLARFWRFATYEGAVYRAAKYDAIEGSAVGPKAWADFEGCCEELTRELPTPLAEVFTLSRALAA